MTTINFGTTISPTSSNTSSSYGYPSKTMSSDAATDRRMSLANEGPTSSTSILLRKLPRSTTAEAVRTMLVFAKDLKETEIVHNDSEENVGFCTAIARFSSMSGAAEAQAMLDGKPNTSGHANMIVEILSNGSPYAVNTRRNTIDQMGARQVGHPLSPNGVNGPKSSRFNGTFQSMEKVSPTSIGSPTDTSPHLPGRFSPQSPAGKNGLDRSRISGKSVISEEGGEEETRELLKDPVAYLNNDSGYGTRRTGNVRPPIAGFSALSLNTAMNNNMNNSGAGYTSPRSGIPQFSPQSPYSPSTNGKGQYQAGGHQYIRHNYPPVNPADQNPPCNTLYVGNLPIDTSEDELKAIFSKQRGYKRLCFRTKQNGPMCFVEFEDISFATKALNELYGAELHNSVKGGIRLSFSKNPLGVRAGQPGSHNPATPTNVNSPVSPNGYRNMNPAGFSTANGPPPGLSAPPGLNLYTDGMNGNIPPPVMTGQYHHPAVGYGGSNMHNMAVRGMPPGGGSPGPGMGMYPDYMLGR